MREYRLRSSHLRKGEMYRDILLLEDGMLMGKNRFNRYEEMGKISDFLHNAQYVEDIVRAVETQGYPIPNFYQVFQRDYLGGEFELVEVKPVFNLSVDFHISQDMKEIRFTGALLELPQMLLEELSRREDLRQERLNKEYAEKKKKRQEEKEKREKRALEVLENSTFSNKGLDVFLKTPEGQEIKIGKLDPDLFKD